MCDCTWMNGLGPGLLGNLDEFVLAQVALCRGSWPQEHGFVGQLNVSGSRVCLGVDCDRLDAQPLGRVDDAARDLAPVCDQYLKKEKKNNILIENTF